MFLGEYSHSIDEKGRLIIPSKFRGELGESFYVTKGLDNCLCLYPETEWEKLLEKLRSMPTINKNARQMTRVIASAADNVELDKQGRILIPAKLREKIGLGKEVVLAGNLEKVEIWSKDDWDRMMSDEDMDAIEAALQECGISF